jgi:protocatechuate 3,4-dioxygenase beta subunit
MHGISRRDLLRSGLAGFGCLGWSQLTRLWAEEPPAKGACAEALIETAAQMEGPFYPDKLPLDTDNDLLIVNDQLTPAVGQVTYLSGRVLDLRGNPVRNAIVEIWQVDGKGVYLHSKSDSAAKRDANFQGFGRFLTGSRGEYCFRTVKPVPYPGRTPHIHVIVKKGEKRLLTTQFYVRGEKGNEADMLYRGLADQKARDSITLDFAALKGSKIGELEARGDIVLGLAPDEGELRRV